jgi:hypothetical protein
MKKLSLLSLILSLFLVSPVFTQDKKPVIRVESFTFEGLGSQESQIIRTLFQSYLSSLGTLVYPASDDPEVPAGGRIPEAETVPNFTFSALVIFHRDLRQLAVTIGNVHSGEISSFNSTYRTTGELVLKARAFLESALIFGIPASGAAPLAAGNTAGGMERAEPWEIRPEPVSERRIAGAWRGDHGIEMIRLWQGGRGLAILSSGTQMELAYTITDNTLFITQKSPNHERYYHPLPYQVARILAARADPMRWEFLLYDNGTTLRGIRISTTALYEGEDVLELIRNSARESGWTRTTR